MSAFLLLPVRQGSRWLASLLIWVLFVLPVLGQNLNASNSTSGNGRVGWVDEPDAGRGTLGIIWSCVTTVFICTWTVWHGNIGMTKGWSRLVAFLWAILMPEHIAAVSFDQFGDSRVLTKKMHKSGIASWKTEHSWLVIMGGFKGGMNFPRSRSDGYVTDQEVLWLASEDLIDLEVLQSPEDILDRSKASPLAKFLACFQASWLVLNVIARGIRKLPITTLELATVAYVGLALATYGFWWRKPQDVDSLMSLDCKIFTAEQTTEFLKLSGSDPVHEVVSQPPKDEEMAVETTKERNSETQISDTKGQNLEASKPKKDPADVRRLQESIGDWTFSARFIVMAGMLLVFGSIHCVAWNWDVFPSAQEQNLWRIASLTATVTPLFSFSWYFTQNYKRLDQVISTALVILYILIRGYITVESFICMRSQPIGVYQNVQWTSFLPHI